MSDAIGRNTEVDQPSPARAASRSLGTWLDRILAPVLPLHCVTCGQPVALEELPWCEGCRRQVRTWDACICPVCRRYRQADTSTCPGEHEASQPVFVIATGPYDQAFGNAVRALKYDGMWTASNALGVLLADRLRGRVDCDCLAAVPTATRKRRQRSYGHAELIAARTAQLLGVPCLDSALTFTRRVADQTRLSAARRQANMKGAFVAHQRPDVEGQSILIVDDVMTTGATMREAARALLAAGARSVAGAVVALHIGVDF